MPGILHITKTKLGSCRTNKLLNILSYILAFNHVTTDYILLLVIEEAHTNILQNWSKYTARDYTLKCSNKI